MELFDKLLLEENNFYNSVFFSPVLSGKDIRIKISNIVMHLKVVRPKNFEGWGVFQPLNAREARLVRKPTLKEKQEYFKLFPNLRLIICSRNNNIWQGIPAHQADTRFKITGIVPIHLAEETQLFDTVIVRFDGNICWFEQIDPKSNLKVSLYLRESLRNLVDPKQISIPGITQEEKDAYSIAYYPAYESSEEFKKNREENKIKTALERAGASYLGHIERDYTYTIEYSIDGDNFRSVVRKENLKVESAGICLSGGDKNFDLQSLIGVIREGIDRDLIVRM